ncbi:MAG TPA: hypothetical protein VL947_08000 [Cytophagales bacterium]|nr:hypothetical protein [Cytophagales bacterium]
MEFDRVYRHGDVILYKLIEAFESQDTFKNNHLVLAEGEATGHAHRLQGDFEIIEQKPIQGEVKFVVHTSALLSHEEHDKIVLEKGVYLKVSQVEYNPFTDLVKKVVD